MYIPAKDDEVISQSPFGRCKLTVCDEETLKRKVPIEFSGHPGTRYEDVLSVEIEGKHPNIMSVYVSTNKIRKRTNCEY
jgi:hypothetical protein